MSINLGRRNLKIARKSRNNPLPNLAKVKKGLTLFKRIKILKWIYKI
jgi:hypothetical protein